MWHRLRRDTCLQFAFLVAAFVVLITARILQTNGHEPSLLDGMYLPILVLLAGYTLVYMSAISLQRFVANSVVFCVVLGVLPAIKYQLLWGGDVNYLYRVIDTVATAGTYNAVREIPERFVGIYANFPGFIVLNVIFAGTTGLPTLEAYKLLFPMVYGIVYPTSFFLLSGLATESANLKRAIVIAATIPYALLPGAPWNYFMMPNYFCFLLSLPILYLILKAPPAHSNRASLATIIVVLMSAVVVTHPTAALYLSMIFTAFLIIRGLSNRIMRAQARSLLSTSLVLFAWAATFGWVTYSSISGYVASIPEILILAFREGIRIPSVTQRLQVSGPTVFLITHISKLAIGSLALLGLVGFVRRKVHEVKLGLWTMFALLFLFIAGGLLFVLGYAFFDIYVGYRSLFLSMIVVTLAAGLGISWLTAGTLRHGITRRGTRQAILGLLLFAILTASLFELYPTEYANTSVLNAVHTIEQKDVVGFLNAHWAKSGQIVTDLYTWQVAESFGAANMTDNIVPLDELPFVILQDPLTTVFENAGVKWTRYIRPDTVVQWSNSHERQNVIYNSGFMMVNSTIT